MLESKTRLVAPALLTLATLVLSACGGSTNPDRFPPHPTDNAVAYFNIDTGNLPYPADPFFFAGSTDGTLNLPTVPFRSAAMQAALNAQDGWSTSAAITTKFSHPLDASTINGNSVRIIKLWLDPTTKAPATNPAYLPAGAASPFAGFLTYNVDYTADLSPDYDSNNEILRITPLKPFAASSGPMVNSSGPNAGKVLNVGYLVVITTALHTSDGSTLFSDQLYADIKSAPANCSTMPTPTKTLVCLFTKGGLSIATHPLLGGIDPATIVLSWSFSTQSVDDTFAYIAATTTAKTTQIVPVYVPALGHILTTAEADPRLASLGGKANIYVGKTTLPYFLTPTDGTQTLAAQKAAVNASFWTAAAAPPAPLANPAGQTDSYLTMFNPAPKLRQTIEVPILVTVPNGNSACASMPAGGWPVAIVQHGITGDRSQALAMADGFADQCFIVVAMDLPLHGVTAVDPANPLTGFHCFAPPAAANPACLGAVERTFDVDFVNNTTGAATPDGKPDSSGAYIVNLTSPLTSRDNLRQAEADLIQLTKSLAASPGLTVVQAAPGSLPVGSVGVDPTRISYVSLSLGAIVGGSHIHFSNDTRTAVLAVPGGVITRLFLDSASLSGPITAGVNAAGLAPNSYLFNLFFRDLQAVIDSGDPINHIRDAQNMHPTLLFKVLNDQVVPNNSTDRLILAGGLTKITSPGMHAVGPGTGAYTFFKKGWHGTLFAPEATYGLPPTGEMQTEAIGFTASAPLPGGPFVPVGLYSTDVLDFN